MAAARDASNRVRAAANEGGGGGGGEMATIRGEEFADPNGLQMSPTRPADQSRLDRPAGLPAACLLLLAHFRPARAK